MLPEAIIFDVDGTLAETEELHRCAFNETFAAQGLDWRWDRDDYRCLLGTTGGKERMARHLREIGQPETAVDIRALHRTKTERYAVLVAEGRLSLRDGVEELIAEARDAGIAVAIATTTSRPNVDALCTAAFGAPPGEIFAAVACGDDVAAKKPAPDVYLLALAQLGARAEQTIAIEDSHNGLQSALAAGIDCIVTPSAYTAGEDFGGAISVIADLRALGGLDGLARMCWMVSSD